jgi:glutamate-1-semialdehyde 2,1-aminomutase
MTNKSAFINAQKVIPGGVNSPVRSFKSVGGIPFFTDHADGCYLYDIEGKKYTDYICSWGANIVGHANEYVVEKVCKAITKGFSFGTPNELETALASQVIALMPHIQKVRLVSSGTEAVMSALRLARGYTRRNIVVKFIGCYHGHSDSLLLKSGSGLATFKSGNNTSPSSMGVTNNAVKDTILLPYNDIPAIKEIFTKLGDDIAAVIIEPFAGNMNLIRPSNNFISTVRELCTLFKSVLIFDEVMTGFRVAKSGASEILNIVPDLTTLGKVIGGGMPLAAFGGKHEIMDCLAPMGDVYQAGTLSGNPIAATCGIATLDLIAKSGFYENLALNSALLVNGIEALASNYKINFSSDSIGGMFGFYFSSTKPQNYHDMELIDNRMFNLFFHEMLKRGVYFAPSMFEAGFICAKHDNAVINQTLNIIEDVFKIIKCKL